MPRDLQQKTLEEQKFAAQRKIQERTIQEQYRNEWLDSIFIPTAPQSSSWWLRLLTILFFFHLLITATAANRYTPTRRETKSKSNQTENHFPSFYAYNPVGMWAKQQSQKDNVNYSAIDPELVRGFSLPVLETPLPPQSINIASINPFSSTMTTCFPITPKVIKRFCAGATSLENLDKIAKAITTIIEIDPIFLKYIHIVFNHLPGFKIVLVSLAETENAIYVPTTHEIYIPFDPKQKGGNLLLIAHELRHAAMHTVQRVKARAPIHSIANYYPLTEAEGAKVKQLMEEGNDRIHDLHNLLKRKEKNSSLSQEDNDYLARLRGLVNNSQVKHYFPEVNLPLYADSEAGSKAFEAEIKGKIGQTVRSELFPYGLLEIRGHNRTAPNEVTLFCVMTDILWTLVYRHKYISERLEKNYSKEHRIFEKDAHLIQLIPIPLLKEFFPNYFQYMQDLFTNTAFPDRIQTSFMSPHEFFYKDDLKTEYLLTYFENINASEMMKTINMFVSNRVKLDVCEGGAQLLIKRKVKIGEANLALGEIFYFRGDHTEAVNYYEVALQKKIMPSADQLLHYTLSLLVNKNYKKAEDICRIAFNNSQHLGWTEKGFKEIARIVAEKKRNIHTIQRRPSP